MSSIDIGFIDKTVNFIAATAHAGGVSSSWHKNCCILGFLLARKIIILARIFYHHRRNALSHRAAFPSCAEERPFLSAAVRLHRFGRGLRHRADPPFCRKSAILWAVDHQHTSASRGGRSSRAIVPIKALSTYNLRSEFLCKFL